MGRQESAKHPIDATTSHRSPARTNTKGETERGLRLRHTRSPAAFPPPPSKKHRYGQQLVENEVPHRDAADEDRQPKQDTKLEESRVLRTGIPKETPASELTFPNRYSPPERVPDSQGFYCFRYGENLSPRFKIISQLGEGTFGLVLECWDRTEKRFVAIKIIRNVEKYRAAAMVELEVLNTLKVNDPNGQHHCVALDKWFNYRGHVCMVFERHGPSLYDFMKKNNYDPFDIDLVRDIGRQLLNAVAFLHELRLVHTDLKPENILFLRNDKGLKVPRDSEICVIDFGSATFEHSHHGRIVSTRHYRAPEVVLGAKWSYECDLWSVGCILVELITGETLFQTHEDIEHLAMMQQVLGDIPSSLAHRCDHSARELFGRDHQLNWPDGASSRKSIRAVRRLLELRLWIADVGDKSVKPCLDPFVDLVRSLMRFEPESRLSAKDALKHPFFLMSVDGYKNL